MSDFLLIGERLNTHRESFQKIVAARDKKALLREVRRQQRAGATHLDVNTSASKDTEAAEMLFVIETILPALRSDVGIVIDSASPECLVQTLDKLAGRTGTIINAISHDEIRAQNVLELAAKHQCGVIAVLSSPAGAPRSADERINLAVQAHAKMTSAGILEEKQFLDPQVLPLAFDPHQPRAVLETIMELRRRWPSVRTLAGLSNISFNMPNRRLLNRTFLAMLLASGINGLIVDPCDKLLRKTLLASRALLGQDDFLTSYLSEITPDG